LLIGWSAPAHAVEVASPEAAAAPTADDSPAKAMHDRGKGLAIAGGVVLGVGLLSAVAAIAVLSQTPPCPPDAFVCPGIGNALVALPLFGNALLHGVVGIPLLAVGVNRMHQADELEQRASLGVLPIVFASATPSSRPAGGGLRLAITF
jgi:hypothetical protein